MLKQIEGRRSVRKYLDKPVEDEKLLQLLEAARLAPSGDNTQPWHFIVIKSEENRKKLAEISHNQKWMLTAPVFIVCVADIRCRLMDGVDIAIDEFSPQQELKRIIRDTAIAAEHIVLEAENQGLSTCWIGWYTQKDIRPALNLPEDKYVLCILTVGYGAETPKPRPRRKLDELIRYEKWQ
jgi:nitroreductase